MADANKINEPYSTSKHDEPTTEHHGIARLEITQLYPINMQNVLPIGPLGNFIPKITLPYRANMHNTLPLGPRGHFMPEITRIPYTANMHNALPLVPRGHFMPEVNQPHPVNMNNALPLVPLGNFRSAPMAPFSIYPVQAANNFRDAPAFTVCTLCQCQVLAWLLSYPMFRSLLERCQSLLPKLQSSHSSLQKITILTVSKENKNERQWRNFDFTFWKLPF
ncbi:uncharacterized protein LOC108701515 isoform X3 [Xenopus laevis]|uniref:Uncharacterized protein LOC108701515 isoform X3 n=1 Tax=Xenopus laevis TaxID=8355 RepID=A0A8J0TVR2_XENLA|nr:uncharacterized protein LOC108701515 isoform X3 [Xenopus laevis]